MLKAKVVFKEEQMSRLAEGKPVIIRLPNVEVVIRYAPTNPLNFLDEFLKEFKQ